MILRHLGGLVGLRLVPVDYEEVTVAAAAIGLTAAKLTGNHAVLLRFVTGPIRFRVDGGAAPTSTVGLRGNDGQSEILNIAEARQLQAIREGATNGTLQATYYRLVP